MKEILAYKKETEGKYRWDAMIDDTQFELYIPKWRIPDPTPSSIHIQISSDQKAFSSFKTYSRKEVEADPTIQGNQIHAIIKFFREHTKTYRYDPIGNSTEWEIGSPYISKSILDNNPATYLYLRIEWR